MSTVLVKWLLNSNRKAWNPSKNARQSWKYALHCKKKEVRNDPIKYVRHVLGSFLQSKNNRLHDCQASFLELSGTSFGIVRHLFGLLRQISWFLHFLMQLCPIKDDILILGTIPLKGSIPCRTGDWSPIGKNLDKLDGAGPFDNRP